MGGARLHMVGPRQLRLLDYLYRYLTEEAASPAPFEIAEGAGMQPGNVGAALKMLKRKGLVRVWEAAGRRWLVTAVHHPKLGDVELEDTVFNADLGVAMYVSDALQTVSRRCLNCGAPFETVSKFMRLCVECREDAQDDYRPTYTNDGEYVERSFDARLVGKRYYLNPFRHRPKSRAA